MQIKEIIKTLNVKGMRIVAPVEDPDVRRIDGEFVLENTVYLFKAYSMKSKEDQTISGLSPMIRIDIKEKEPF